MKPKRGSFESKQYSFIRAALRKASYRWPERNEALKAARIGRGLYQCYVCKEGFRKGDYALDHIDPVVPATGFTNWHDFALRLYCKKENFAVICNICHQSKTLLEKNLRKVKKKVASKKKK